jgi:hypothetical protein
MAKLNRSMFAACMLMAVAASANADVVQCIDGSGMVTYTDQPCPAGAQAEPVAGLTGARNTASSQSGILLVQQTRDTASAARHKPRRGLAPDVVTMQTARSSMISKDHAAILARQQALAQRKSNVTETSVFSLVGYL